MTDRKIVNIRSFPKILKSHNVIILGESHRNLPVLVEIIAEALHHNVLDKDEEVKNRILNLTRTIMANQDVCQACLSILNEDQKTALKENHSKPATQK